MNNQDTYTVPPNPITEGDVIRESVASSGETSGTVFEMDDDMIFDTALATMQVSVSSGHW